MMHLQVCNSHAATQVKRDDVATVLSKHSAQEK